MQVAEKTRELVAALKQSDVYLEYKRQLKRVRENPELYHRVNEYRNEGFALRNDPSEEGALARQEAYVQRYQDILSQPVVEDFLAAELALCRKMQEIERTLVDGIDFDFGGIELKFEK